MSDTKAERLADALNDFIASSPDVEAAAVVTFDGLAMASALPDDMDEDRLGAMSAALLSLGEQAATGLGRGDLSQVFVEGKHGYVFLMSARDQAVLAAITTKQAKIGFILFEMRRAADEIGGLLEERAREQLAAFGAHLEAVPDVPSAAPVVHAYAGGAHGADADDADGAGAGLYSAGLSGAGLHSDRLSGAGADGAGAHLGDSSSPWS